MIGKTRRGLDVAPEKAYTGPNICGKGLRNFFWALRKY
jgi:hypothetical protein